MHRSIFAAAVAFSAAWSCRSAGTTEHGSDQGTVVGAGSLAAGGASRPPADLLVDTDWLEAHRTDPAVRIVDLRPAKGGGMDPLHHIPGAVWIDEASLRDGGDIESWLPPPERLASIFGKAGIGDDTRVVGYDAEGGRAAARLWYVLAALGHDSVSILDGGFPKWKAEGRPLTDEIARPPQAVFTARPVLTLSCPAAEVGKAAAGRVVLDARSPLEWAAGRIPGAVNVDWKENVTGPYPVFKPASELRQIYQAKGITPDKEVVTYCASGGRASHSLFTLRLLGYPRVRVYYGSWADWTRRPGMAVER